MRARTANTPRPNREQCPVKLRKTTDPSPRHRVRAERIAVAAHRRVGNHSCEKGVDRRAVGDVQRAQPAPRTRGVRLRRFDPYGLSEALGWSRPINTV